MSLRDLRTAAKMTQLELATKIEVDQAAISNWESGKNPPLPKYQKRLCQIFGCTAEELFEEVPT